MRLRGLLVLAVMLTRPAVARADEGGIPFWFSGQYASLAAVPANPGLYLPVVGYYWYGKGGANDQLTRGEALTTGLKSTLPMLLIQPTYVPKPTFLGGRLALGVGWGAATNWTKADVSLSPTRGMELGRSDTVWGITDLYPVASLAWGKGSYNGMAYLTGDMPIGSYDSKRLSNTGIGHGAIDAGGGFTYFDQTKGHEASAVVGFTYNFENTHTKYKNGVDSHLDWALSQFLSNHVDVGIVGYLYLQVTGDSGSGDRLGSFRSDIAAVGPQFIWAFTMNGMPTVLNVRGYWEFWSEHRLKGAAAFATLVIPIFGTPPPPPPAQ
jgi:hypothetical protein